MRWCQVGVHPVRTRGLPWTAGSLLGNPDLRKRKGISVLLRIGNQYHDSGLRQQSVGRTVSRYLLLLAKDLHCMDVGPGVEYPHHSPTLAWGTHLYGRCTVLDNEGPIGLDAGSSDIPPYQSAMGSSRGGLVCLQTDTLVSNLYLSWWPDTYAVETDAFLQAWLVTRSFANPLSNLVGRVLPQKQAQTGVITSSTQN